MLFWKIFYTCYCSMKKWWLKDLGFCPAIIKWSHLASCWISGDDAGEPLGNWRILELSRDVANKDTCSPHTTYLGTRKYKSLLEVQWYIKCAIIFFIYLIQDFFIFLRDLEALLCIFLGAELLKCGQKYFHVITLWAQVINVHKLLCYQPILQPNVPENIIHIFIHMTLSFQQWPETEF